MKLSPEHMSIDPAIGTTMFACDLAACKGACCALPGGRGAPLLDEEMAELAAVLPVVLPTLSDTHTQTIELNGFVEGGPGDYHTTCVDGGACVFVRFSDGIAHCSIEQAWHRGEVSFRKPLSCHLFPVRLDEQPVARARFEFIPECMPAIHRGRRENVSLVAFVSDALQRAFGERWQAFKERLSV